MSNNSDFEYSDDGCANLFLMSDVDQDINFFVEDSNKEYEYENIFKRLFPQYVISKIFSSGGKKSMISIFNTIGCYDERHSAVNIFIVDSDFDPIIFKNEMINSINFIYLDSYNFEDLLINENACIILAEGIIKKPYNETKKLFDFKYWFNRIITEAKDLFFLYCYIKKYFPYEKTIGNKPSKFIDDASGFFKDKSFDNYLIELKNKGIAINEEKLEDIKENYELMYGNNYMHLICGKFLLFSLFRYSSSKGIRYNNDYYRWWLICNADLNNFNYLKNKITLALNNTAL